MATDSVMGLFATPEQIQQQQYQQAFDRNLQLARLNPRERNVAMLGTSVDRLGSAIGGALGGQDPQLARATQRRAFIQQVNMADPKALAQAIQASSSDPELSTFLMGKYKELTGIQKDQSIITKNENWEKAQGNSQEQRALVAEVDAALAGNQPVDQVKLNKAKIALSQLTSPQERQLNDGTILVTPAAFERGMFPSLSSQFGKNDLSSGRVATVKETPATIEATQTQAETAKEAVATVQNAMSKVDEAAKLYSSSKMAGGYAQLLSGLPNSDAKSLANLTANIKAAFSVEEIAKLKAQSKTGATGFGALAVKELETIQNAVTTLDPADKNFPAQLKTIRESFDRWKKLMEQRGARAEAKLTANPDVAPKQNPLAGQNPQIKSTFAPNPEAWIKNNMDSIKGFCRADVIKIGIEANRLPANYQ